MEGLAELDKIGYVRYASVYRDFRATEDFGQFIESEKLREDEGDWKATKKVLVKEVKSCRAQILALQAERDGLKEQNEMLKRAIVSTGGGGKSNGSNRTPPRRRKYT